MSKALVNVIGIGASAGGLEAMQSLVDALPKKLNSSALIFAQHLSADYKSMLTELLSRRTKIHVIAAESGHAIEVNTMYVAPPNGDVFVNNGHIEIRASDGEGAHPSVSKLFQSMADDESFLAHGVILSGTGKDGSVGLQHIKEQAGKIYAQDPGSAKYDGMPQSAIDTGLVDETLAPKEIAQRIAAIDTGKEIKVDESQTKTTHEYKILSLLEKRIGVDFSDYKASTLRRRLDKRISSKHLKGKKEYLHFISKNPSELDELFQTLLIGVTAFYRNEHVFKKLQPLLRKMISEADGKKLKIWVPACSSGDEAYTYALIFENIARTSGMKVNYQIFATDIDTKALTIARTGMYRSDQLKAVPKTQLKEFFVKKSETTYEVSKDIRKNVLFSRHDIVSDPPFLRLDLVSCRNLLIYFNLSLQKQVMPLFYYALKNEGLLVLGKSENIAAYEDMFKPINAKEKVFARKKGTSSKITLPKMKITSAQKRDESRLIVSSELSLRDRVRETIYETYENPYLVVNEQFDILEMNGDVQRFLSFKQGIASLNAIKLSIPELQIEMRTLSKEVTSSDKPVVGKTRRLKKKGEDQEPVFVRLLIKPLAHTRPHEQLFIVIFDVITIDKEFYSSSAQVSEKQLSPREDDLEQELDATKEHLNSLVEELETSNEELQSLNEEMQASNEELQASNEELETSNEELQATNEELDNAYSELREANEEISQRKDEIEQTKKQLATVFHTSSIGFILVDNAYVLKMFNKKANEFYEMVFEKKLRQGGLYVDMVPEYDFALFQKSFKRALAGETIDVEREYTLNDGTTRQYVVNYAPVNGRRKSDKIKNVVMSFIDVTSQKTAENELKKANKSLKQEAAFLSMLTNTMRSHIWTADANGKVLFANEVFLEYIGMDFKTLQELPQAALLHPDEQEAVLAKWADAKENCSEITVEHHIKDKDGNYKWFLTQAKPLGDGVGSIDATWIGASTNIEHLKRQVALEQNISDLEKAKQELVNLNSLKDDFVSLASHQLRTPATAVKQYIAMTLSGYAGDISDKQRSFLDTAYASNERQLDIINDLLKTAQVDTIDYKIKKRQTDIVRLTRSIISNIEPYASSRGQKINLSSKKKQAIITVDGSEIELVLTNLIENACKYSYDNATITVLVIDSPSKVSIKVADNGVGLDKMHYAKIFDKFTRVDNELSDTVTGTGLGLYISNRIVEAHGGSIDITDNKPKGTTFTVTLPRKHTS